MDSEASSSSTAANASAGGSGSKKPKSTKRREKNGPNLGPNQDKSNHVLVSSPPGCGQGGTAGSEDESGGSSPSRTPRPKAKSKTVQRRRKASASPIMIEDIIEGFAITSFKSVDHIESYCQRQLDDERIVTVGFTPTVPSTPSTPIPPATDSTPTTQPELDIPQLPLVVSPHNNMDISMDTLDISQDTTTTIVTAPVVTTTCTETTLLTTMGVTTSPQPSKDATMVPPVVNKTPSKSESKPKKESSKKSKKMEKVASSESVGSGSSNSSIKENKVQSSRSTPNKASTPKTSRCAQEANQPPTNSNTKPEPPLPVLPDLPVKEEFKPEQKVCHTNNNNNHKLKGLDHAKDNKDSINKEFSPKDGTNNVICKTEHYTPNHAARPSHIVLPACLLSADGKPRDSLDSVLVKPHQIIVEEPLLQNGRQNGQSVSSLSVSSLTSDRSSSRDRLSDASSTGRAYLCDSEGEIECLSKASDAGSESLFTTKPAKNREHILVPPALHNGVLHSVIPVNPHHASNKLHHPIPSVVKVPAATTANVTKVTPTTTTASISTGTSTTVATSTTLSLSASSASITSPCASSLSKSQTLPASISSAHISTSSQVTQRTHTPVHREQPRPIPGLSGTRPEERDRTTTPTCLSRSYNRAPAWPSSGHSVPVSQLAHSSPHHISPASVNSLSLPALHHTASAPNLHHHTPLQPHHHTPPAHHHTPPAHHHTPPAHHHTPPHHLHTPPAHHGIPPHSMFAPPIVPPAALTSSALQVHNPLGVDPLGANHELLGRSPQELSQRYIAERLNLQGSSLPSHILNSFHQHHHQHQHMHHYGPYGLGAGLLYPGSQIAPQLKAPPVGLIRPPPTLPDLEQERAKLDKFSKLESPLYRPGFSGLPGPLGLQSMLPPSSHGLPSALGSNLGAFQPKSGPTSALHPSQLLLPLQRDGAKPQPPSINPKKSGKWCAAHVRIAWEIHIHQQKQAEAQRGSESTKPSDMLRPPSHLLAGSSLHRPELSHGGLLPHNPHSRSPFESGHNSLQGGLFPPGHLGAPPFQRPSPYAGLSLNAAGGFGGLGNIGGMYGREMPTIPGLTSPHEWNRLHRTPPSFPTPPAWPPKSDAEREREKERERERERDLEREREREREKDARERERERDKERERDRSTSREPHHHLHRDDHHREREGSQSRELNHRERDRDRELRDKEHDLMMKRSPSREPDRRGYMDHKREARHSLDRLERSRSRSPVRNGPESMVKHESPYPHGSPHIREAIKVKEERKDDIVMIDDSRDRRSGDPREHRPEGSHKLDNHGHPLGRNNILLPPHTLSTLYPPNSALDRRHIPGAMYDRPGPHLWHPFERSPMDPRMEMVRDIEREREREQLRRLSNPLGLPVSAPSALSLLEADKLREQQEMLLREHAAIRDRERLMQIEKEQRERILASFTASHHDMERSKIPPPLRTSDSYHPAFGGPVPNSMYHPSGASRPPSNSSYHHPSGASRPPSSPVIINHNSNSSSSKSNSPSVVGAPPPLIPSIPIHNHTGSPAPNPKVRPPTPITNNLVVDKDKIEVNSNGLDTDTQAR